MPTQPQQQNELTRPEFFIQLAQIICEHTLGKDVTKLYMPEITKAIKANITTLENLNGDINRPIHDNPKNLSFGSVTYTDAINNVRAVCKDMITLCDTSPDQSSEALLKRADDYFTKKQQMLDIIREPDFKPFGWRKGRFEPCIADMRDGFLDRFKKANPFTDDIFTNFISEKMTAHKYNEKDISKITSKFNDKFSALYGKDNDVVQMEPNLFQAANHTKIEYTDIKEQKTAKLTNEVTARINPTNKNEHRK